MIQASYSDKKTVVSILAASFDHNKSVHYIIKQDQHSRKRIRQLMQYSFHLCMLFGKVFLTDDKIGCALIIYPDWKKTTLKTIFLDIQLIFTTIGLKGIAKTLRREAAIQKMHPSAPFAYLWFIGVDPDNQHKGIGTQLLDYVINDSHSLNRPVYLETSTERNIPWYKNAGFHIFSELDLPFRLYFLRREI